MNRENVVVSIKDYQEKQKSKTPTYELTRSLGPGAYTLIVVTLFAAGVSAFLISLYRYVTTGSIL